MPSAAGLLEQHELAARRRVDGLREEAEVRVSPPVVVKARSQVPVWREGLPNRAIILIRRHAKGPGRTRSPDL
ncbi:hypothetical protein JGS39_03515 [Streptomyces sp. P01-B04]|uniref:hypothetical protein n=1 Tax=Streptomyces poriferorum TaxID=2798799 RepID=UPI001C602BA7|nr:hypothetical protein [Streptomyces poriferorum]MBW5248102.1 hypothetical protein [Streptomyces poriferorum]MBW5255140.1 hypothetical protein [Streptomyces poriferorum]